MVTHVPSDNLVADFAAGVATPGESLLMAAHMTHAPTTRARVQQFEELGGGLLEQEAPAEMSEDALSATLALLDAPATPIVANRASDDNGPLPSVVLNKIGCAFDEIPWKFQLPGVAAYELDGFEGERVSLLRARPGAKVPQHTHNGPEMTLVLQGVLSDGGILYGAGDLAVNTEDDDHRPEIVGTEDCYCLIVQQGSVRFTGRLSRFLNYLGE